MSKAALDFIRVEWAEAYDDISPSGSTPFTVETWSALDSYLKRVYDSRGEQEYEGTYSKVKVHIEWVNGESLTDRIDVGDSPGDYKPSRDAPIGLWLRGEGVGGRPRTAMYSSSFQYETDDRTNTGKVTQTTRDNVAWTDYDKEGARLKRVEERRGDHSLSDRGGALNDLYYVVVKEYEKWDEGETVNWTHIEQVCKNMINALRSGE